MIGNKKQLVFDSFDDFRNHATKSGSTMVVYKNEVYDLSQFMYRHSGGQMVIASYKGKSVDHVLFSNSGHMHSPNILNVLAKYKVGYIDQQKQKLAEEKKQKEQEEQQRITKEKRIKEQQEREKKKQLELQLKKKKQMEEEQLKKKLEKEKQEKIRQKKLLEQKKKEEEEKLKKQQEEEEEEEEKRKKEEEKLKQLELQKQLEIEKKKQELKKRKEELQQKQQEIKQKRQIQEKSRKLIFDAQYGSQPEISYSDYKKQRSDIFRPDSEEEIILNMRMSSRFSRNSLQNLSPTKKMGSSIRLQSHKIIQNSNNNINSNKNIINSISIASFNEFSDESFDEIIQESNMLSTDLEIPIMDCKIFSLRSQYTHSQATQNCSTTD